MVPEAQESRDRSLMTVLEIERSCQPEVLSGHGEQAWVVLDRMKMHDPPGPRNLL